MSTTGGGITGETRAAELRNIRGRLLTLVGDRINLDTANRALRAGGLAEYTMPDQRKRWGAEFPRIQVSVAADEDPHAMVTEKYREFLTAIGVSDPETYTRRYPPYTYRDTSNPRVPAADTVALL